jgi:hypothetical protein
MVDTEGKLVQALAIAAEVVFEHRQVESSQVPHRLCSEFCQLLSRNFANARQASRFWPSVGGDKKEGHNLGTRPKGDKRSFKFDQPGAVPLLCNVHPEMSGYVVVSPTPYFALTDSGSYKIENIPDGKYNVIAWHEGM